MSLAFKSSMFNSLSRQPTCCNKIVFFIVSIQVFLLVHSVKWQRVEQFVEPVVCRVVDVRVLTQVVTQHCRVGGVVGVEVVQSVQRHQNDQSSCPLLCDPVMQRRFEFKHAVRAETQTSSCTKLSVCAINILIN